MARRQVPVPRSRFIPAALGISFAVSLAVVLILLAFHVRLGQGYFAYRYSQVRELRTPRALAAVPVMGLGVGAVWLLSQRERMRRGVGVAAFVLAMALAGAWCGWAPPSPILQHMFNFTSPSSDGAFFVEAAGQVRSVRSYLHDFPRHIREETPESMRGTRVLSNPPGMQVLMRWILPAHPGDRGWLEERLTERGDIDPTEAWLFADTLRVAIALCAIYSAAGVAAYLLGRVFLSPPGAATFALIATFNPAVVHFVPGKDPAQLLTINLMLWAWLIGWKRNRWPLCGLAGAMLVIGSTFGLIHIWVALAAWIACCWHNRGRLLLVPTLAAIGGGVVVVALAWLSMGWNIPLTLWAVSRRWGEIQKTFEMSRAIWYVIGLPIFLLFLSPGFWTLLGLSVRRWRIHFGTRLFLSTLGVMLFTYFAVGMTYELPRLWIAFLPPLTLGLAINFPLLRARGRHPAVARVLMLIVLTQMIYTTFHWTLFDVRETEYRLISQRYYH